MWNKKCVRAGREKVNRPLSHMGNINIYIIKWLYFFYYCLRCDEFKVCSYYAYKKQGSEEIKKMSPLGARCVN